VTCRRKLAVRNELCGLRRSDVHLRADSRVLGCAMPRAHLHLVRRDNPNGAWAKSRRQRVVPLDFLVVQTFDVYAFERFALPRTGESDFLLVNLFRRPSVHRCARIRSTRCSALSSSGVRWPVLVSTSSLSAPVNPPPPLALCAVSACTWQRRHPDGRYCGAHQQRLRSVRTRDAQLDESHWQATEPAIGRGGEVSLRGLAPLVVAELLAGLQQRCRINAVKTSDAVLRALCNDVRRRQVDSLTGYIPGGDRDLEFIGLATVWSVILPERCRPRKLKSPSMNGT